MKLTSIGLIDLDFHKFTTAEGIDISFNNLNHNK